MATTMTAGRRPWGSERTDIPRSEFPTSTRCALVTEWVGKLGAVAAIVLFVLVMMAIHKGLLVQHSAKTVVTNFRTTNQYFDTRADLTAPATARKQLEHLRVILADLNAAGARDVEQLSALLPDASALLAAGRGDSDIARKLQAVAASLQTAAKSINQIAESSDTTVQQVGIKLAQALALTRQLNAELYRTTVKLAPIPAQDGIIPAPGEK